MTYKRDIEFLFEIGSMFNVDRMWRQHLGMKCATVPEHTIRVIWLSLVLARQEKGVDENKLIKMALVHDTAETRTSDLSYMQKIYTEEKEAEAARDLFNGTNIKDYEEVLLEYKERKTIEAKIVKDADNLDVDFEMKEFEERGSLLPAKWKHTRQIVRDEKLYTEAAKKMWDELQNADPADWHLTSNKWYKLPETGK